MITAGLVDRAIDRWETEFRAVDNQEHGLRAGPGAQRGGSRRHHPSQPTVSALVLVLNEAVRDGIIPRNPATDRAVSPHGRPFFRQLANFTSIGRHTQATAAW